MTDTPAAAKLLQAQEAARLCSVSDPMFAVHLQTMRDFILNTRPQPAPPEGEPDCFAWVIEHRRSQAKEIEGQ